MGRVSKMKCVQCGESFDTITEYEKHLETCDSNKTRKKTVALVERLKQASEDFK